MFFSNTSHHQHPPMRFAFWLVSVLFFLGLQLSPNLFGQSLRSGSQNILPKHLTSGMDTEGDPMISAGAEFSMSGPMRASGVAHAPDQISLSQGAQPDVLNSLKVDKRFEGFGFDDNPVENGGFLFIPPDPMGAAGKKRVLAVANTMIELRTKDGKLKWRDSLRDFFSPLGSQTLGTFTFDPKVVYDHFEDRFLVVALEQTQTVFGAPEDASRILVAVSKKKDPKSPTAADWNYLAIDSKTFLFGPFFLWADYPGFEVDEEAVYITANMFTFFSSPVPGAFGGVRLWIIDKGEDDGFYDGGPATVTQHDPYATAGIATTTMPALIFGEDGAGAGIGTFLVSYSGLSNGVDEFVQVVRVDDPLGSSGGPFFSQQFINIGNIEDFAPVSLPDAPQAGTTVGIEVNDRRALDAVWRDNALWFTTTINPNSGPDAGQTTAHWFKLNTDATGFASFADQGDIGGEDIAPGTFTFFPSVGVNKKNEVKFGFSASAATIFAGAFVAGRQPGDAPGSVQGAETVHAGEDSYVRTFGGSRNRWGDYSGIAVDPDNNKFWVFNEFADTRGTPTGGGEDGRWGTAWARCKFTDDESRGSLADAGPGKSDVFQVQSIPSTFALEQNYPNPFNPETRISYQLPVETNVVLKILNVRGQLVRTLVNEFKAPGTYQAVWDGRNASGRAVTSGIYFYQLKTDKFVQTRKLTLLK